MTGVLHIGCCGWHYIKPEEFADLLPDGRRSKLQAYAHLFDAVEINSSYYAIPRPATAEKWRRESAEVNQQFEFTVKAFQGITHYERFGGRSLEYYRLMRECCSIVGSEVLLFQSPANFHPTRENISRMQTFFGSIDRTGLTLVWEPRGSWYDNPDRIAGVCSELDLVHCVDPLRDAPTSHGTSQVAYFRLHGFGRPNMYDYSFSEQELQDLHAILCGLPLSIRRIYVMFNNAFCYRDAGAFGVIFESCVNSDPV